MQLTLPYRDGLPGRKEETTSLQAAKAVSDHAKILQGLILECLRRYGNLTSDECASRINQNILAVRPRFSELKKLGRIEKTKDRRKNTSGMSAIVWKLVESVNE